MSIGAEPVLMETKVKLASLYAGEDQLGTDGFRHKINDTRVVPLQGEHMAALHRELRPQTSIEIGLAYGYSALYLLDAMMEHGYGHHLAIDPFQAQAWHGIGVAGVDALGFSSRFEWLNDLSLNALVRLQEKGTRAQYVFIDGSHTFDGCLIDFCCADKLLDVGGLIILDDMWMPSIRNVASFIRRNMVHYELVKTPCRNICCLRKSAEDGRDWEHFREFGVAPDYMGQLYRTFRKFQKRIIRRAD